MLLFNVHVYSLTTTFILFSQKNAFILEIKGKLHLLLIVLLLMPFVFLNDYNAIPSLDIYLQG
jgi:hypothetical protein